MKDSLNYTPYSDNDPYINPEAPKYLKTNRKSNPKMACQDGIDNDLNNKIREYIQEHGEAGLIQLDRLVCYLYPEYKQKPYFKLDSLTFQTRIYVEKIGHNNFVGLA